MGLRGSDLEASEIHGIGVGAAGFSQTWVTDFDFVLRSVCHGPW